MNQHKVMTDNTRELTMGEIWEVCEHNGTKLYMTVLYHPVSNGVTEWMISVLTGAIRATLHDSGLPDSLWAEAFSTAVYVHNTMPMKMLEGCTPFELLYRKKADVTHLHAFGAPCAIVKPLAKLKKLDDWVRMCYCVGYKYGRGGYRVDPREVVVETRDVTFFVRVCHRPYLLNS